MRWRGPPDLAAPDTAISCSASEPLDQPPSRTPARSPSCPVPLASGVPPGWYPFSVVRAFLRPSCGAAQGVVVGNFKIFWPSTNCPQFSGSYPLGGPDSPQEVHRWRPDRAGTTLTPGRAARKKIGQAAGDRRGQPEDRVRRDTGLARRSAGTARTSSAKPEDGQPVAQEIGRARTCLPGRMHRTGRSRATGRTAQRNASRGTAPDKGRGPSTHEMEGPFRSSGAGHSYLMLSVRAA